MACVYVLRSKKDGKLYIGSTRLTPAERLAVHNRGSVRSTKARRPFELCFSVEFDSYREAKKKELFFKTGFGRQELKNILRAGLR